MTEPKPSKLDVTVAIFALAFIVFVLWAMVTA